jgi:steroid delta-isomerase-like uncharacterized protein
MKKDPVDTGELLTSYGEVWNEGEYSKISELVSESLVLIDPTIPEDVGSGPRGEARGADGLEAFVRRLRTGFPDFEVTTVEVLFGEGIAMDDILFTGTHRGELGELAPTGRTVEMHMMSAIIIENGTIREHRVYLDQKEFADQLRLTFPALFS